MYPTPRERIKNPVPTAFGIGDVVKILIGPATGKRGVVVVDRNGNFVDYEPYAAEDAIGVSVFEKKELDPDMEKIVVGLTQDPESLFNSVVRWFDSPDQLELIERAKK